MDANKRKFNVLRTDHTSFTVRNLDEALNFWVNVLGFELHQRQSYAARSVERLTGVPGSDLDVAVVNAPGHRIELVQYLSPPPEAAASRTSYNVGSAHVAFEVDCLEELIKAIAETKWLAGGAPLVVQSGPRKGQQAVYVRHPDGMTIELIQPNAP